MLQRVFAICLLATFAGCVAPSDSIAVSPTVATYVDAYNDGDLESMSALMHPDIMWITVDGDTTSVMASGRDDLVAQMTAYIESGAATQSRLSDWATTGRFVSVKETATWDKSDGSVGSQSSIAVYELDENTIRRVWYYPAE